MVAELPNGPRADDVIVNGSCKGRKRQSARCGTALGSTRLQKSVAFRHSADGRAGTQFRHMVSNIAVTITGNRAAASAYLLVLISKDGNHCSLPPGRYACELIKEDSGQWRFSRRTVFHDHDYTLDGIGR